MKISTVTRFVLTSFFAGVIFVTLAVFFGQKEYDINTILILGFAITWATEKDRIIAKKDADNQRQQHIPSTPPAPPPPPSPPSNPP